MTCYHRSPDVIKSVEITGHECEFYGYPVACRQIWAWIASFAISEFMSKTSGFYTQILCMYLNCCWMTGSSALYVTFYDISSQNTRVIKWQKTLKLACQHIFISRSVAFNFNTPPAAANHYCSVISSDGLSLAQPCRQRLFLHFSGQSTRASNQLRPLACYSLVAPWMLTDVLKLIDKYHPLHAVVPATAISLWGSIGAPLPWNLLRI